ncbi:MAG TPA: hypothetical protein VMV00_01435 [Candidatus Baltobacteraceae bacterium]|nr:hypothetical protein [Candidatus Baltobacteraceae bacterium]
MAATRHNKGMRATIATTLVLVAVAALCMIGLVPGIAAAQSQAPNNARLATLQWLPVAGVGVLAIIAVAALVFVLSGLTNSQNARAWSRIQVYEGLLSIVMVLVFAAFSFIFTLSPQNAFQSMGLVPSECTGATTIQTLGTCDMSAFNKAAFQLADYSYLISLGVSLVPDMRISIMPINGQKNIKIDTRVKALVPWSGPALFGRALSAMLFVLILSQVQLLLLSASTLFFTFFMSLGLISRTFGFTRGFGGSMIALGLGLGIIYPLMVSITFGFVDTNSFFPSIQCLASAAPQQCFLSMFQTFPSMFWGIISPSVSATTNTLSGISSLVMSIGYFVAGLTFIPFLNFVIVDTFIVDFSKAVGERMDFMSLLTTLA